MDQIENQTSDADDSTDHSEKDTELIEDDPALLARAEVVQGKFPGQERIRIVRPSHTSLKRVGTGMLQATEATSAPPGGLGRAIYKIKRTLIGAPIANEMAVHERLTKVKALAILSSDAISSVAYATEASLGVLILAGTATMQINLILAGCFALLILIVGTSYRQTIYAYPQGGGSYIVARDNLGDLPGLIAAASLLIDYVLTVSVSVAAGVGALVSAITPLTSLAVPLGVFFIALIMV